MREEAVIHDAIVLLNNIIIHQPKIPASQILLSHYRSNRYIGAGDRQAIGDLVHGVLRHYYALEADQIGDTEEIVARYLLIKMELNTKDISTIFSGRGYGPKSLSSLQLNQLQEWHEEEKKGYPKKSWRLLNCPKWLYEPILAWWGKEKGQALLAKLNEPSLPVLRINTQKATLKNTLAHLNKIGITATTGTALVLDSSGYIKTLSSSLRYKKDVEPIDIGLDFVLQLNPVKYNLKEGNIAQVGFIAEDFPEKRLVSNSMVDDQDESKGLQVEGVNYAQIVAPLVKAIQEQQALITAQAETINAQSAALAALTARIVALEGK